MYDDNWVKLREEAAFTDIQLKAIETPMGRWLAAK